MDKKFLKFFVFYLNYRKIWFQSSDGNSDPLTFISSMDDDMTYFWTLFIIKIYKYMFVYVLPQIFKLTIGIVYGCLLYTSDAADE